MCTMKKIENIAVYYDIAYSQIKNKFQIVDQEEDISFPAIGYPATKIMIAFQNQNFSIILEETKNDIVIRLFDTRDPELYYRKKEEGGVLFDKSTYRSNKPYILNVKYSLMDLNNVWLDKQQNIGKMTPSQKEVVRKMEILAEIILDEFRRLQS